MNPEDYCMNRVTTNNPCITCLFQKKYISLHQDCIKSGVFAHQPAYTESLAAVVKGCE